MTKLAKTPTPPYYAVIFTSVLNAEDSEYIQMAQKMLDLASGQDGFLGFDSARNDIGISISYWKDHDSIQKWKENGDHLQAKEMGRKHFYTEFQTRISKVVEAY